MSTNQFDPSTAVPEDELNKNKKKTAFDPSTAKEETKGLLGNVRDTALSLGQGAIGIGQSISGLAGIVSGGRIPKALENEGGMIGFRPQEAKDTLEKLKTDQSQLQKKTFSEEDGVLNKTKYALQNPSLIGGAIVESAPSMLAGGAIAKGIGAIPKVGQALGAVGGAAIGEGIIGAGAQAENIRNETDDGLLTGKQAAIAAGTGVVTAGLGALGGKVAQKLGIADVDTAIASGSLQSLGKESSKGILRKTAEGAAAEGFLEELPQSVSEQMLQNFALDKDLSEGVADAAVLGTLAGGAMGGGLNLASGIANRGANNAEQQSPAQSLGIDANVGPLSSAAATAVDTGVAQAPMADAQPKQKTANTQDTTAPQNNVRYEPKPLDFATVEPLKQPDIFAASDEWESTDAAMRQTIAKIAGFDDQAAIQVAEQGFDAFDGDTTGKITLAMRELNNNPDNVLSRVVEPQPLAEQKSAIDAPQTELQQSYTPQSEAAPKRPIEQMVLNNLGTFAANVRTGDAKRNTVKADSEAAKVMRANPDKFNLQESKSTVRILGVKAGDTWTGQAPNDAQVESQTAIEATAEQSATVEPTATAQIDTAQVNMDEAPKVEAADVSKQTASPSKIDSIDPAFDQKYTEAKASGNDAAVAKLVNDTIKAGVPRPQVFERTNQLASQLSQNATSADAPTQAAEPKQTEKPSPSTVTAVAAQPVNEIADTAPLMQGDAAQNLVTVQTAKGKVKVDMAELDGTAKTLTTYTNDGKKRAVKLPRADVEFIQYDEAAKDKAKVGADGATASNVVEAKKQGKSKVETVSTPTGRKFDVRHKVVEADSLLVSNELDGRVNQNYPQDLQPRDRTRTASQLQVNEIANNINPLLLSESPNAANGAPIVSNDNVVESGNGRTLALKKAYQQGKAENYKTWLKEQGYDVSGMKNPVLVRERVTPMTLDERLAYTKEANEKTTLELSDSEQSAIDAGKLSEILPFFNGGEVDNAQNRDFVKQYLSKIVSVTDRGGMIGADGVLSQKGKRRIQAALLFKAYGDASLVTDLFESADTNIKGIGGALIDVSGFWAVMRDMIARNEVSSDVDTTANLLEAVNLIRKARTENRSVYELSNQDDIFAGQIDPATIAYLNIFYSGDQLSRARGREKVADALKYYVDNAMRSTPGDNLFGEKDPDGLEILRSGNERIRAQETNKQQDIFAGSQPTVSNTGASGTGGQRQSTERQTERSQTADDTSQGQVADANKVDANVDTIKQGDTIVFSRDFDYATAGKEYTVSKKTNALLTLESDNARVSIKTNILRIELNKNSDLIAIKKPKPNEQPTKPSKSQPANSGRSAETTERLLSLARSQYNTIIGKYATKKKVLLGNPTQSVSVERSFAVKSDTTLGAILTANDTNEAFEAIKKALQFKDTVKEIGKLQFNKAVDVNRVIRDGGSWSEIEISKRKGYTNVRFAMEVGRANNTLTPIVFDDAKYWKMAMVDYLQELGESSPYYKQYESYTQDGIVSFEDRQAILYNLIELIDTPNSDYLLPLQSDSLWMQSDKAGKSNLTVEPAPKEAVVADTESISKDPAIQVSDTTQAETPIFSLDGHVTFLDKLYAGDVDLSTYKQTFQSLITNKPQLIEQLSAMTKAQLFERFPSLIYRYKNDKKDVIVDAAYMDMVRDFSLSESVTWSYGQKYEDVIAKMVEAASEEKLKAYAENAQKAVAARKAEAKARIDGVQDPKTLDDFNSYLRLKLQSGMTYNEARMTLSPEKRALMDSIAADATIAARLAKGNVQGQPVKVAGQTVDAQIVETKHTKKGHDLFVVKLAERVEREDYNTLNAAAKQLGGYYSAYRGNGAIAGFQFTTIENAQAFVELAGGNSSAAQNQIQARRSEFDDDKTQTSVERLKEMAEKLSAKADEKLSQDRKANTARRAEIAARMESAANAEKSMAVTMGRIAEGIENNSVKYLKGLRTKAQVEMLEAMVSAAQNKKLYEKYPNYNAREQNKYEAMDGETADYAVFPTYSLYRSDWASLGRKMLEVDGLKKIGQTILSIADDVTSTYLAFAKENIDKVSQFRTANGLPATFKSKDDAQASILGSGFKGKAIVLPYKRGENRIILSPAEAKARGLWNGDDDSQIAIKAEFATEIIEKIGKSNRGKNSISLPWQLETAHEKRERLKRMGVETAAEMRSALREFIALKDAPAQVNRIKEIERNMVGRKKDGLDFFPTPAIVADEMIATADIQDGMSVLEPSAGMGHIAERIRLAGFEPDVVEISADRKELLELKGFRVVGSDFLEITPRGFTFGDTYRAPDGKEGIMRGLGGLGSNRVRLVDTKGDAIGYYDRDDLEPIKKNGAYSGYDRIIMNPPFSDRRDMQHVQHAYDLLKPGGRLVAIVGEGVFFGSDKKATAFRDWVEEKNGSSEKLDEGTFLDASLPVNTAVNARMLVIDKPEQAETPNQETIINFSKKEKLLPDSERKGASPLNTIFGPLNLGEARRVTRESVIKMSDSLTFGVQDIFGGQSGVSLAVVESFDSLPLEIQEQATYYDANGNQANYEISGVWHKNTLYIVADTVVGNVETQLTTVQAYQELLTHEIIGHYGAQKFFGRDYKVKFKALYAAIGGVDGIRKIAERNKVNFEVFKSTYIDDYLEKQAQGIYLKDDVEQALVGELISFMVQNQYKQPAITQKFKILMGYVRDWLRKAGVLSLEKYNDYDLMMYINEARKSVANGKPYLKDINTSNADGKISAQTDDALKASNKGFTSAQAREQLQIAFGKDTIASLEKSGVLTILDRFPTSTVEGFEYKGRVVLVAPNLNSRTVVPTLLHELGGHAGMQKMMKPATYQELMSSFNQMVANGNPLAIQAKMLAERDTQNTMNEYLPYLLTVAAKSRDSSQRNAVMRMVQRIISAIKAWLVDRYNVRMNLTPDDMVALAERMVQAAAKPENTIQIDSSLDFDKVVNSPAYAKQMRERLDQVQRSEKTLLALNGKPSNLTPEQYAQVRTPEFKAWFGDWENDPANASKVVDENGEPLVVYHGSPDVRGILKGGFEPSPTRGSVYFFSDNYQVSDTYADPMRAWDYQNSEPATIPFYVLAKNPMVIDANFQKWRNTEKYVDEAKNSNHDGIIIKNSRDEYNNIGTGGRASTVFATFKPQQSKSAATGRLKSRVDGIDLGDISNTGSFDPNNPDIRYSLSMGELANKASENFNDAMNINGQVSWWHKSVGTMYNLAQRNANFKPVFDAARRFIDDVSFYATVAAEKAPNLIPQIETIGQIFKTKPITAEDNKAIAKPIFEGTLLWSRDPITLKPVLTDALVDIAAKMNATDKAKQLLDKGKISKRQYQNLMDLDSAAMKERADSMYETSMLKPGINWTDDELRSMFNLNDKQIGLYKEFKLSTSDSLDKMLRSDMLRLMGEDANGLQDLVMEAETIFDARDILQSRIMKLIDSGQRDKNLYQVGKDIGDRANKYDELLATGYAPLSRFGQYAVTVRDSETGEVQYFSLFESKYEANKARKAMQEVYADGYMVTSDTVSQEEYKLLAGMTPETLEIFGQSLGLGATANDAASVVFQNYIRLTKNNRSAMKRLLKRKGIAGYSEDVPRVAAAFIYSNSRQTAGNLHMGDLDKAVDAIPKGEGQLKDVAMKLREYIKNPQEEGQTIKALLFAQYLGGSIASAAINFLQPIQITAPYLTQFGNGSLASRAKNVVSQMTKAAKDMGKQNFEADLARDFKRAEEDGTLVPQEVFQLMGYAQGKGSLVSGDGSSVGDARAKAQNLFTRVSLAWGKPFGLAEMTNRRLTYIAAYRIAKQNNNPNPDAFARHAVDQTQFIYSKASRMRWGRGVVGGVLMTFKTYTVSYMELLSRMWNAGEAGSQQRKQSREAVLMMLAILILVSGVGGLPGAEDLEDIIETIGRMAGYNFDADEAKRNFVVETLGLSNGVNDFIERGISGLPGVPLDVSGRLGMGNLIPATSVLQQKDSSGRDFQELAGPVGDLANRTINSTRMLLSGDVGKAALEISPVAVRNAAQGVDMAMTGAYRDKEGDAVNKTDTLEAVLKGIGFQPSSTALRQRITFTEQSMTSNYIRTKEAISKKWASGIFLDDPDAIQEARDQMIDWNMKNPEYPITIKMNNIMKRVRNMGTDKLERIADRAPDAARADIRERIVELEQ